MSPLIKKGSNNKWVKVAKYLTGYSVAGKATSSFDSKFKTFVINWQKNNGLVADGEIGENTWTKIAENAPVINSNSKAAIYAFQTATGLTANGSYNTATKNTIIAIQCACNMSRSDGTFDGVCDSRVWKQVLALKPVTHKHTVNYKQNDSRWGSIMYSATNNKKQTIANSGCCPTSVASVLSTFFGSTAANNPVTMAKYAVDNGYRRGSGGTDGGFISFIFSKHSCKVIETTNTYMFKHCIDSGGYVICAFKPGSWWTSTGHYSPCWSYDSKYYYVDNTISKIKIKRSISKLSGDCRAFYCVYP